MSPTAKVSDILVEDVHTVRLEATVLDAILLMLKKDVGCLVVVSNEGPMGIITKKDILRRVTATKADPSRTHVKEVMSTPLIATTMTTSIGDAAKKMIDNGIKRLVVMGDDYTFLGLVTMTDIVRWTAKQKELSDSLNDYLKYDVP